jgi:hypothetical protein
MQVDRSWRRVAASIVGLTIAAAHAANAQYFGRNKVQYEEFNFRILETPHFDIYYYPSSTPATRSSRRRPSSRASSARASAASRST